MNKSLHIFRSFEEQEQFHTELMSNSNIMERFRKLYEMQQMTRLLHPIKNSPREIKIIRTTKKAFD